MFPFFVIPGRVFYFFCPGMLLIGFVLELIGHDYDYKQPVLCKHLRNVLNLFGSKT